MKKILILIVGMLIMHSQMFGQTPSSIKYSIDSLSYKVENIQHQYNYLKCDFELYKMQNDFNIMCTEIAGYIDRLLIYKTYNAYDNKMATQNRSLYLAAYKKYETLKKKYDTVTKFIATMVAISNFSESQLNVIEAYLEAINQGMKVTQISLDYYKATI